MHEMFNAPGKYKSRGEIAGDAAMMAGMVMDGLIVVRKARGLIERAVKTVGWRALARKGMKDEAKRVLGECLKFEGMFGEDENGGSGADKLVELVEATEKEKDGEAVKGRRNRGDPSRG